MTFELAVLPPPHRNSHRPSNTILTTARELLYWVAIDIFRSQTTHDLPAIKRNRQYGMARSF